MTRALGPVPPRHVRIWLVAYCIDGEWQRDGEWWPTKKDAD